MELHGGIGCWWLAPRTRSGRPRRRRDWRGRRTGGGERRNQRLCGRGVRCATKSEEGHAMSCDVMEPPGEFGGLFGCVYSAPRTVRSQTRWSFQIGLGGWNGEKGLWVDPVTPAQSLPSRACNQSQLDNSVLAPLLRPSFPSLSPRSAYSTVQSVAYPSKRRFLQFAVIQYHPHPNRNEPRNVLTPTVQHPKAQADLPAHGTAGGTVLYCKLPQPPPSADRPLPRCRRNPAAGKYWWRGRIGDGEEATVWKCTSTVRSKRDPGVFSEMGHECTVLYCTVQAWRPPHR